MFAITFENEIYKRWSCEFLFSDFRGAKEYLIKAGFVEKNRLFERKEYNWSNYVKAYITPMKFYKK